MKCKECESFYTVKGLGYCAMTEGEQSPEDTECELGVKSRKSLLDTTFGQPARELIRELNDPVNHPSHYTDGKIEVIDYIEDKKLQYHLGNAVKYISRAGKKDPKKEVEDLKKAKWYLDRYIKKLEETK